MQEAVGDIPHTTCNRYQIGDRIISPSKQTGSFLHGRKCDEAISVLLTSTLFILVSHLGLKVSRDFAQFSSRGNVIMNGIAGVKNKCPVSHVSSREVSLACVQWPESKATLHCAV